MSSIKEFGDFQTPKALADEVVKLLGNLCPEPGHVIEPTAGLGTFLKAARDKWGNGSTYQGYEINAEYVEQANHTLARDGISVSQGDFFAIDWKEKLAATSTRKVLLLGNPPWVNNSTLGGLNSGNLPAKTNFQGLRGLDAMTGKANFDISEWMLIRLLEVLPDNGAMAMLCKTATARKVLRHFWKRDQGWMDCRVFRIDAKEAFDVSVDACLFFVGGGKGSDKMVSLYETLENAVPSGKFGLIDGELVRIWSCVTLTVVPRISGAPA
jgi:methylase of polypeptide subunit release factors